MVLRRGDYINDLVSYIEGNLGRRYREDQLRFLLINQGYSRSAVEKAFRIVKQKSPPTVQPIQVEETPVVSRFPEERPEPKRGFFSRLFSAFSSKKKVSPQVSEPKDQFDVPSSAGSNLPEKVRVDSDGNLLD